MSQKQSPGVLIIPGQSPVSLIGDIEICPRAFLSNESPVFRWGWTLICKRRSLSTFPRLQYVRRSARKFDLPGCGTAEVTTNNWPEPCQGLEGRNLPFPNLLAHIACSFLPVFPELMPCGWLFPDRMDLLSLGSRLVGDISQIGRVNCYGHENEHIQWCCMSICTLVPLPLTAFYTAYLFSLVWTPHA
jgi:hypothetical protein